MLALRDPRNSWRISAVLRAVALARASTRLSSSQTTNCSSQAAFRNRTCEYSHSRKNGRYLLVSQKRHEHETNGPEPTSSKHDWGFRRLSLTSRVVLERGKQFSGSPFFVRGRFPSQSISVRSVVLSFDRSAIETSLGIAERSHNTTFLT